VIVPKFCLRSAPCSPFGEQSRFLASGALDNFGGYPNILLELYTNSVFWSVFGRYFSGITNTIPKKNSVVTFRYQKGGSAPLFPQKGGNGPLFEDSNPLLEKRGEERGEVYKKGGKDTDRNTENPANLIPAKYQYQKNCW